MNNCPCSSQKMIRHFRHHQIQWFCRSCWQPMPVLDQQTVGCATTIKDKNLIDL